MPCPAALPRSCCLPRVAALALIAFGAAGCSESARFDSNPFASQPAPPANSEVTGSIAPRPATAPGRVETQPLPQAQPQGIFMQPVQAAAPLPPPSQPATVAAQGGAGHAGVATGAQGLGAYRPGGGYADVTGSVQAPTPQPAPQSSPQPAGWSWEGGTAITVGKNETIETIARKYGVPSAAIMQSNGITTPTAIRPGQRLVIPRYSATGATPAPHTVASAPAKATPPKPATVAAKPPAKVVDVVQIGRAHV